LTQFRSGDSHWVSRGVTQSLHAAGQGDLHTASALFAKLHTAGIKLTIAIAATSTTKKCRLETSVSAVYQRFNLVKHIMQQWNKTHDQLQAYKEQASGIPNIRRWNINSKYEAVYKWQ
jgi:hypothetical protein